MKLILTCSYSRHHLLDSLHCLLISWRPVPVHPALGPQKWREEPTLVAGCTEKLLYWANLVFSKRDPICKTQENTSAVFWPPHLTEGLRSLWFCFGARVGEGVWGGVHLQEDRSAFTLLLLSVSVCTCVRAPPTHTQRVHSGSLAGAP